MFLNEQRTLLLLLLLLLLCLWYILSEEDCTFEEHMISSTVNAVGLQYLGYESLSQSKTALIFPSQS
jgi:hypothetical protein